MTFLQTTYDTNSTINMSYDTENFGFRRSFELSYSAILLILLSNCLFWLGLHTTSLLGVIVFAGIVVLKRFSPVCPDIIVSSFW